MAPKHGIEDETMTRSQKRNRNQQEREEDDVTDPWSGIKGNANRLWNGQATSIENADIFLTHNGGCIINSTGTKLTKDQYARFRHLRKNTPNMDPQKQVDMILESDGQPKGPATPVANKSSGKIYPLATPKFDQPVAMTTPSIGVKPSLTPREVVTDKLFAATEIGKQMAKNNLDMALAIKAMTEAHDAFMAGQITSEDFTQTMVSWRKESYGLACTTVKQHQEASVKPKTKPAFLNPKEYRLANTPQGQRDGQSSTQSKPTSMAVTFDSPTLATRRGSQASPMTEPIPLHLGTPAQAKDQAVAHYRDQYIRANTKARFWEALTKSLGKAVPGEEGRVELCPVAESDDLWWAIVWRTKGVIMPSSLAKSMAVFIAKHFMSNGLNKMALASILWMVGIQDIGPCTLDMTRGEALSQEERVEFHSHMWTTLPSWADAIVAARTRWFVDGRLDVQAVEAKVQAIGGYMTQMARHGVERWIDYHNKAELMAQTEAAITGEMLTSLLKLDQEPRPQWPISEDMTIDLVEDDEGMIP